MVWSLGVAAVAAIAVVVATRVVILLQRESLTESAEEFAKYKVNAGLEIAQATARAEEAILAQERIKAAVAWRRLTKEQHDKLVSAFKETRLSLFVCSLTGDPEGARFRDDIVKALSDAGMKVTPASFHGLRDAQGHLLHVGLNVWADGNDMKVIKEGFAAAGITLVDTHLGLIAAPKPQLIVGTKPTPF